MKAFPPPRRGQKSKPAIQQTRRAREHDKVECLITVRNYIQAGRWILSGFTANPIMWTGALSWPEGTPHPLITTHSGVSKSRDDTLYFLVVFSSSYSDFCTIGCQINVGKIKLKMLLHTNKVGYIVPK